MDSPLILKSGFDNSTDSISIASMKTIHPTENTNTAIQQILEKSNNCLADINDAINTLLRIKSRHEKVLSALQSVAETGQEIISDGETLRLLEEYNTAVFKLIVRCEYENGNSTEHAEYIGDSVQSSIWSIQQNEFDILRTIKTVHTVDKVDNTQTQENNGTAQ